MNTDANNPTYHTDYSLSRHRELLPRALPDAADTRLFNQLMAEAKAKGLNWMQGLEYVIEHRGELLN